MTICGAITIQCNCCERELKFYVKDVHIRTLDAAGIHCIGCASVRSGVVVSPGQLLILGPNLEILLQT